MNKNTIIPFSKSEYDVVRKLSVTNDTVGFMSDIRCGSCERMYDELQRAYKEYEDDILFVLPTKNSTGILGIYTRNLYDAYKHDYLPKSMIGELIDVICKHLKDGYQSFPRVLDACSLNHMHPELRVVVEKYMKTIHTGQVLLSTEICEIRDTSWGECFEEPFRDVLLVLNI